MQFFSRVVLSVPQISKDNEKTKKVLVRWASVNDDIKAVRP
jgi:hypothetical protein